MEETLSDNAAMCPRTFFKGGQDRDRIKVWRHYQRLRGHFRFVLSNESAQLVGVIGVFVASRAGRQARGDGTNCAKQKGE